MTKPKYDLILELADYTESHPDSFWFGFYNVDKVGGKIRGHNGPSCGTLQCMLGNAPLVWPEQWRFNERSLPVTGYYRNPWSSAIEFFNISHNDYGFLFTPNNQYLYDRPNLGLNTTAKEVADNARWWVQMKRKEAKGE